MAVLVNQDTKVLIQGITGKQGSYHANKMLEYGVQVLAGVTPGKAGQQVEGLPVYDTVADAVAAHPALNATMVVVGAKFVKGAVIEALEAGLKLLVVITEFIPVHDVMQMVALAREKGAQIVGPNTIGIISPGKTKVGVMPGYIYKEGHIGVISRSGTLTHEIAANLTFQGFGQSTCIGIGGDMVIGINHREALELFEHDEQTDVVVLLGEIGGSGEEAAAQYLMQKPYPKPVLAYIAGSTAPEGKTMGHAGAIVSGGSGSAKQKMALLEQAGVRIAQTLGQIVDIVAELAQENPRLKS